MARRHAEGRLLLPHVEPVDRGPLPPGVYRVRVVLPFFDQEKGAPVAEATVEVSP